MPTKFLKTYPVSSHLSFFQFLGCQYVVGTIAPYLASYFGVGYQDTSLILPLIFITNIFVMPFGAQLAQKKNPKL